MTTLLKRKKSLAASKGVGLTYQQKVVADGASNYWRLSETSGLYIDSIGGKNGTVSGTIQRGIPGAISGNTAVRFIDAASAGKITLPVITLTPPFSIECWMKTTDITAPNGNFIFTNRTASITTNFYLYTGGTANKIQLGPNTAAMDSITLTNNGQWHYIVGTVSGSQNTIYVDGALDVQLARTVSSGSDVGSIGWDNFASFATDLSVDELAIYPLILTPTQVAAHYALR